MPIKRRIRRRPAWPAPWNRRTAMVDWWLIRSSYELELSRARRHARTILGERRDYERRWGDLPRLIAHNGS